MSGWLEGLFKLSGTLKNPTIASDYSDVAMEYLAYFIYVATRGLSLPAEIVANKMSSNEDACGKIPDGTVFGDDGSGKSNNTPQ